MRSFYGSFCIVRRKLLEARQRQRKRSEKFRGVFQLQIYRINEALLLKIWFLYRDVTGLFQCETTNIKHWHFLFLKGLLGRSYIMTNLNEIYKCEICGNVVQMVHGGKGEACMLRKPYEAYGGKQSGCGKGKACSGS